MYADGVNEVKAMMQLTVRLVTDEMLLSSVTVRLADMTEQAFLSPLLDFFIEGLAAIIPCPKENVYVFSIQVGITYLTNFIINTFKAINKQFFRPKCDPYWVVIIFVFKLRLLGEIKLCIIEKNKVILILCLT